MGWGGELSRKLRVSAIPDGWEQGRVEEERSSEAPESGGVKKEGVGSVTGIWHRAGG